MNPYAGRNPENECIAKLRTNSAFKEAGPPGVRDVELFMHAEIFPSGNPCSRR